MKKIGETWCNRVGGGSLFCVGSDVHHYVAADITLCDKTLSYSITQNNTCTITPTLTINNFFDLSVFYFESPNSNNNNVHYRYVNNQLIANIDSGVNYMFKYRIKGCDDQVNQTLWLRVDSISLQVTQPNCIHSFGYVDIINSNATAFYIDSILQQPNQRPFRALPGLHTFYAVNPATSSSCTMEFLIEESTVIGLPYNIKVNPEHCGQRDGEIITCASVSCGNGRGDVDLRTNAVPNTVFTAVNGVFRDVPLVSYTLYYSIDNCPLQTLEFDNAEYNKASITDYTLTHSISRMPQCSTGEGEMTLFLNVPQSNITYSLSLDYLGGQQISLFVPPNGLPNCTVPVNFIAPTDYKLRAPYLLVVESQPTCKYSKDGQLYIEAKETISKVQVGSTEFTAGQSPDLGGQTYSQIQSGPTPISIFYKYCPVAFSTILNITFNPSNSFEINISITNVTNCNSGGGIVKVLNAASYSQLNLNGQTPNANGEFLGLSSGDYILTFTSSGCSGTKIVSVGGPLTPPIQSISIYRPPMCYGNGGAYVLFNTSAVQYTLSALEGQYGSGTINSTTGAVYFNYLQPGLNNLEISAGNCNWPLTIDSPSDPRITTGSGKLFTVTNEPPMCSFSPGKITIEPLYSDVVITDIQTNSSTLFSRVGNTLLYSNAAPVAITVKYSGCTETIVFQPLGAVQPPEPAYNVSLSPCSTEYNVTIKFSNHTLYDMIATTATNVPVQINTTTGVIDGIVPGTALTIQYSMKSTRCSGVLVIDAPVTSYYPMPAINTDGNPLVSKVVRETCFGSLDGSLTVTPFNDSSSNFYLLYDQQRNPVSPSSVVGSAITFSQLTSQTYRLVRGDASHPFCASELRVDMTSTEPTLNVASTISCGLSNGTINSQLLILNVTGELANFNNVAFQLDPITNTSSLTGSSANSAIFSNIQGGIHIVTADIADPICPRHLVSTVSVGQVEVVAGANSTTCSTIQVTPSIANALNVQQQDKYNFKLYKDGQELSVISKLPTVTFFNLDSGEFTVVVEHFESGCSVSQQVSVESCPSDESSRSKVGMITGATLGSIIGAAFLGLGGYLAKKK
ncbi:hypothetical protein DFA_09534 [Cavenderia fasciculata]|uniref:Uncharacterized protein n=1 Tax=Cavenderia fasciculata TaxID=261658 RepID=F4Q7W5_CACFS|nr:uncharacterized protein DFA_09534 [Cavenderia fasciculata]EGG15865.1 hypothetical protein DFA_09534 [Cavenderia fasciculata]|eukprot:XP_004352190.1 hypothetical protein DFA_09534 [Cavenderia fasciculata]